MRPRDPQPPNLLRWLALDIGGANLKAAHSDRLTRSMPFEVWRHPSALGPALASLAVSVPPFDRVVVTMTAELCDCFHTKTEGVIAILDAVEQALGEDPIEVWGTDGRFHQVDEIRRQPLLAAAANWLALAIAAADILEGDRVILIDIGSTTTDLIPIDRGNVAARGRTDTERLRNGELVYAGVRRTPVCALATELAVGTDPPVGLAAELFATTHDIFLTLGDIEPDPTDLATADGRPTTVDFARGRLARMIGADHESFSADDALALSRSAEHCLLTRLAQAVERACRPTIGAPTAAIIAGSGEFLARRLASLVLGPDRPIVSLAQAWGREASSAACAHALLELARSRAAVDVTSSAPRLGRVETQKSAKNPPRPIVIKVGGSLLDWPELPQRLAKFLDILRRRDPISGQSLVLLAGGGPAADVIRTMDRIHGMGDMQAHRLAIRALDWTADLLAVLLPDSIVVDSPDALGSIWKAGHVPILAPRHFLEEIDARRSDPLPACWNVTSDSIAARLASHLGARSLILLKSTALSPSDDPERGSPDRSGRPGLPAIAKGLELVETVCLRDPDPHFQILRFDSPGG